MKTAIRTIARYETTRPPRGLTLLSFFMVALQHGVVDAAAVFERALLSEVNEEMLRTEAATPEMQRVRSELGNIVTNNRLGRMDWLLQGALETLVAFLDSFPSYCDLITPAIENVEEARLHVSELADNLHPEKASSSDRSVRKDNRK